MTEPCETCGGPASDEEVADLYARLERRDAHARRWKALARRLRERWGNTAGLVRVYHDARDDEQQDRAREIMESAARYGAQIERLQRERDEERDAHERERRSHDETLKCSERYLRERDQEREAHAESKRRDAELWGGGEAEFWAVVQERDTLAERVRVLEQNNRDAEGRYDACYAELTRVQDRMRVLEGALGSLATGVDFTLPTPRLPEHAALWSRYASARAALDAKEKPSG